MKRTRLHRAWPTRMLVMALAGCGHAAIVPSTDGALDTPPVDAARDALDAAPSDDSPADSLADSPADAPADAPVSDARSGYVAVTTYFDPATTLSSSAQVGFENVGTPVDCAAPAPDLVGCSYVECPIVADTFTRPEAGTITLATLATMTPDTRGNYIIALLTGNPWSDGGVALHASAAGGASVPAFTLPLGDPGLARITAPAAGLTDSPWSLTNGAAVSIDWSPHTAAMEVTLLSSIAAGSGILRCVFPASDHAAAIPGAMIARLGVGAGGSFAFATLATSQVHAGGYTVTGFVRRAATVSSTAWAAGEFVVQ